MLVSAHREENVDYGGRFGALLDTLQSVRKRFRMPVIVSTHPRTRKRLQAAARAPEGVRFPKPLGFAGYIKLHSNVFCVLSDGGTITEESSILGFPAVMLREAHERPEGIEEGMLIMACLGPKSVLNAIGAMTARTRRPTLVPDCDVDDVATRVVNVVLSHTDCVNRTAWWK